ncbi:MAG: serine/threonine protein kinase [Planctomycetes bacterium]|nr:serine/threonine protein kinase [Planctomycetota bacterium]
MSENEESAAFDPTVIENHTLGLSQLDQDLVDEAIRQGLITQVQGQMVLQSIVSTSEVSVGSGTETVALMVDRGLIPKDKAEELLDSLTEEFVPGYRLGKELGRGAMGVVYEATQKKLGRKVALKVVNPSLSGNADYVVRFKREAQTLAKLNHPNIVQLYDFGEANGRIFLALEFVEGEDVSNFMQREGRVKETKALQIVRDVALGLSHGHQSGVVHRDVKPANLLLLSEAKDADGKDFTTKVTDFGLAREQEHMGDGELTQEGTILGTPAYMAPEQTQGVQACHRCDIYALGATLYHMLTGTVPFQANSVVTILLKKQTEKLENPQIKAPELSSQAVALLDRMLSRTPTERYQDYESLLSDVDLVLAGQAPAIAPLGEEHSSLQLTALVQTEVRKIPVLPTAPSGKASQEGASLAPLFGVIAVVVLLGLAYVFARPPSADPTPTPSVATLSPQQRVEAKLAALKDLPGEALAGQAASLAAIASEIEALPETQRDVFLIKHRALVDKALSSSEVSAPAAFEKAWKAGEYVRLGKLTQERLTLLKLVDIPPSAGLTRFRKRAQAAAKEGAGEKERALWAEIEDGWNASPRDVSTLLRKLDDVHRFSTFSPELETVGKRRIELQQGSPQLQLKLVPASATLLIDGEEQAAGPFKRRLAAGPHEILVKAEGYRDYVLTLELAARHAETLYLAPLPKRALKEDPSFVAKRKPVLNPRIRKWEEIWKREGEWSMRAGELPAGLDGSAEGGLSQVTNQRFGQRCVQPILKAGGLGWTITWHVQPFQGSVKDEETKKTVLQPVSEAQVREAAAEVRLLESKQGTLAVGFERGRVYVGLRKTDGLYQRWTEPYAGAPPEFYRVNWDLDVAEVYLKPSMNEPWRFFHSVRLEEASDEQLSLVVLRGRVLFSNLPTAEALVPEQGRD